MPTGTGIKVKDAMISKVITAKPSDSVYAAAKLMKDEDVGMLVVVEGGRPAGVITREDVVVKVVAAKKDSEKVKIKDVMGAPVITSFPDEDIADAARKMSSRGYERIPVVSMGKLVGIVSDREVAKVAPAAIEILRERLLVEQPETGGGGKEDSSAGECELCGNYNETLHNVNDRWVCDNCKEEAGEL